MTLRSGCKHHSGASAAAEKSRGSGRWCREPLVVVWLLEAYRKTIQIGSPSSADRRAARVSWSC